VALIGDQTCHDQGTANFNCPQYFHDMTDCPPPSVTFVESAVELQLSQNQSSAIMEEGSAARLQFTVSFAQDVASALMLPVEAVVVTGLVATAGDGGRRRAQSAGRGASGGGGRGGGTAAPQVTVVVQFEIECETAIAATAVVDDIVEQASTPSSALMTGSVTSSISQMELARE